MSMIRCEACGTPIDTDFDTECYVEVGNMRNLHKEIILCETCREGDDMERDEPAELDMLQADAELAWHRYLEAKRKSHEHTR